MNTPGIWRRLAAAVYDALLLLAVLFVAAFVFLFIFGSAEAPPRRLLFQLYLLAVCATYFLWFWTHGGQTLAMRTWHLRLVDIGGGKVGIGQAALRFVLAGLGLALLGAGWWWALFDRDRCFLHDRFAGTRLVLLERR